MTKNSNQGGPALNFLSNTKAQGQTQGHFYKTLAAQKLNQFVCSNTGIWGLLLHPLNPLPVPSPFPSVWLSTLLLKPNKLPSNCISSYRYNFRLQSFEILTECFAGTKVAVSTFMMFSFRAHNIFCSWLFFFFVYSACKKHVPWWGKCTNHCGGGTQWQNITWVPIDPSRTDVVCSAEINTSSRECNNVPCKPCRECASALIHSSTFLVSNSITSSRTPSYLFSNVNANSTIPTPKHSTHYRKHRLRFQLPRQNKNRKEELACVHYSTMRKVFAKKNAQQLFATKIPCPFVKTPCAV